MKLSTRIAEVQDTYKVMIAAVQKMKEALDLNDTAQFEKEALNLMVTLNTNKPGHPEAIRTPKDTTDSYQTNPNS